MLARRSLHCVRLPLTRRAPLVMRGAGGSPHAPCPPFPPRFLQLLRTAMYAFNGVVSCRWGPWACRLPAVAAGCAGLTTAPLHAAGRARDAPGAPVCAYVTSRALLPSHRHHPSPTMPAPGDEHNPEPSPAPLPPASTHPTPPHPSPTHPPTLPGRTPLSPTPSLRRRSRRLRRAARASSLRARPAARCAPASTSRRARPAAACRCVWLEGRWAWRGGGVADARASGPGRAAAP